MKWSRIIVSRYGVGWRGVGGMGWRDVGGIGWRGVDGGRAKVEQTDVGGCVGWCVWGVDRVYMGK